MTQDAKKTVLIQVSGMHCGNCVEKVRKSLAALPGVDTVAVDLAAQTARVQFSPAAVTTATLLQAVRTAGFTAAGFTKG